MMVQICFLLLTAACCWHVSRAGDVTVTGRILCDGQPVKYAVVSMWDDDLVDDDAMGSSPTDNDGYFSITGEASDVYPPWMSNSRNPDVYVRSDYILKDPADQPASLNVQHATFRSDDRSDVQGNLKEDYDFGTLDFSSDQCRVYLAMYEAMQDFFDRTGFTFPFEVTVKVGVWIHGGTAFAQYQQIKVPADYNFRMSTAKHELAHTLRHHYDGSAWHFARDVARFWYPQNHNCRKQTNEGFAFNEGWAEYWAGTCFTGVDAGGPYDIEGDVASALDILSDICSVSPAEMWSVLRDSPGMIHSFPEFEDRLYELIGCEPELNCPGEECICENVDKSITTSTKWRIWTLPCATDQQFAWDVCLLEFFSLPQCDPGSEIDTSAGTPIDSGHTDESSIYDPQYAFVEENLWGGRVDGTGAFWIGMEFQSAETVRCVRLTQCVGHGATQVLVQAFQDGSWENVWLEYDVEWPLEGPYDIVILPDN